MNSEHRFPGFKRVYKDGYFKYPNELENYWYQLTGSEVRLLGFILRRTVGFNKLQDHISLSQFVGGVGKNGRGPGVSRAQVQRAIAGLETKGFIVTEKQGYHTRLIKLALREDESTEVPKEKVAASDQVVYLISLFRGISPHHVDGYMTSKTQIQAMEKLLKHYEPSQLESFIAAAQDALHKKFAPTITSPVELERNLTKLIAFYAKNKSEEDRFKSIF